MLNSNLENMIKFVRMLRNGSDMLDEILEIGKMSRNMKPIRFNYNSMNKENKVSTKNFVPLRRRMSF